MLQRCPAFKFAKYTLLEKLQDIVYYFLSLSCTSGEFLEYNHLHDAANAIEF